MLSLTYVAESLTNGGLPVSQHEVEVPQQQLAAANAEAQLAYAQKAKQLEQPLTC